MRRFPGKYADLIEEWLHSAAIDSDGFGDVASPFGYIYRLVLNPEAKGREDSYLERKVCEWFTPYFLVTENDQGFVFFHDYETVADLDAAYEALEGEYDEWLGELDD